jgi:hypothetical protein
LKLLEEQRLGGKSEWKSFLGVLTPSLTPWVFPPEASCYLDGTELEPVLRYKVARLEDERKEANGANPNPQPEPCNPITL